MTIRHNCETHGCYIKTSTPDWGFLDSAFSNKIRVGDIDGIVEVKGRVLILEWKTTDTPIPKGQEIMFKNITSGEKITVIVIWGDPKETIPTDYQLFWNGIRIEKKPANAEIIKDFCRKWEARARGENNNQNINSPHGQKTMPIGAIMSNVNVQLHNQRA